MFQTDDAWEQTSERDVLRSLFNQPGLRRPPLVEVAQNVPLFHVDVVFEGEAEVHGFWSRFVGTDLATVVRFLNENEIAKSRISVQTVLVETDEYRIRKIDSIYEVSHFDGATSFVYGHENGERVFDRHAHGENIGRLVWPPTEANVE